MESLAFVVAAAALLVVLHVAVAAYFYRAAHSEDRDPDETENGGGPDIWAPSDQQLESGDSIPCPTCGTPNDPSYQFCRRCVADLSGTRETEDGASIGRLGS